MTNDESAARIERLRSIILTSTQLLVPLLMIAFFISFFGYYDYLHDEGREQACDKQFGTGSEWVANLNSFSQSGIVCETPDGTLKRIDDVSSLPIGVDTLSSYLGKLGGALL